MYAVDAVKPKTTVLRVCGWVLCAALLNTALSFQAIWPTIFVKPDWRMAPEAVFLMLLLTAVVALKPSPARSMQTLLRGLAGLYTVMVLLHYADVVVPHLLGRPVNLYWDLPQIPRFVWVTAKGSPVWISVAAVVALVGFLWALYKALYGSMRGYVFGVRPFATHPVLWCVLLGASGVGVANYAGVQATWPYVAKPVVPTYWKEADKLLDAFSEERAKGLLPDHTVIDEAMHTPKGQALAALKQKDVMVMLLETYGAMLYDQPDASAQVDSTRKAWEKSMQRGGRHVLSAFYTSPTIGGASDLAHMSLLSGIDLSNPRRHDVLLTTHRPTLITLFQKEGYEVFGLYHSVAWDWVERIYYGYDTYISGPDLLYKGPAFGFWKIPDQFAIAQYEQMYPRTPASKPRLTVWPTISTHFPFYQVPPYQPDWKRVLGPMPFDEAQVRKAQAEQVNWGNMRPDYLRTVNYSHQWLAGYFNRPEQRETVYILLGDHQPTGSVTGPDASWDVPVYVVSKDPLVLERFRALGFSDGITPKSRASLGGLHTLTADLLRAFSTAPIGHAH